MNRLFFPNGLLLLTGWILTLGFGCQAPPRICSLPVTASVKAVLVLAESATAKNMLGADKHLIHNQENIARIFILLEKYKDQSKTSTFDFSPDYDFSVYWQIRDTGKADTSHVFLQVNRPRLLTYSIKSVDDTTLMYTATISESDAEKLWEYLEIKPHDE
ncbi:MAG: hypothetical protein LBQ54_02070 [Planctomycetaceae bacterium]|nr:hypothetical protein [Planctomycetaceae bacterium]